MNVGAGWDGRAREADDLVVFAKGTPSATSRKATLWPAGMGSMAVALLPATGVPGARSNRATAMSSFSCGWSVGAGVSGLAGPRRQEKTLGLGPRPSGGKGFVGGVGAFTQDRSVSTRIPQMDCQFDDLLGRFCYKNQCNTIIATGQTRLTLRVTQESSLCGSISTAA